MKMNCVERMPLLMPAFERSSKRNFNPGSSDNLSGYTSSLESTSSFPEEYVNQINEETSIPVYYQDKKREIVVDENLRATDLCHLLILKLNLNRSQSWSLILLLPEEGLQRFIEDDEEVLCLYKQFQCFKCKLLLEQDSVHRKFGLFEDPAAFFLFNMISFDDEKRSSNDLSIALSESVKRAKLSKLQNQLLCCEKLKILTSGPLRLARKFSNKEKDVRNVVAQLDTESASSTGESNDKNFLVCSDVESGHLRIFNINQHSMFLPVNEESSTGNHQICLINEEDKSLNFFGAKTEIQRQTWISTLRLARYGLKPLRQSYFQIQKERPKTNISPSSSYYNGYMDMDQGKVAIDYTHKDGPRIIDDPLEALAIADHEANEWRKRYARKSSSGSVACSVSPTSSSFVPLNSFNGSPSSVGTRYSGNSGMLPSHRTQPWFYPNMTREEATKLLLKYGTIDGVFLVRTSNRNPNCFVLSFAYNSKIHHAQIQQMDELNQTCLSLDCGKTKFYDLQQLIEFYQLNLGLLPTKLTHFLVHKYQPQH